MAIIKMDGGYNALPISYKRGNPIPLDRSSVWYDYDLMVKYAKGEKTDWCDGATAYVGQILSLVDSDDATKAKVYVITDTAGTLEQVGIGALSGDLADINGQILTINENITTINAALDSIRQSIANVYTKAETDAAIAAAVVNAAHLKRKEVASINDINVAAEDAERYIYMVPSGLSDDDNKYYEYIVIEITDEDGEPKKIVERVGSWSVDLSGYATTTALATLEGVVNTKVTAEDGKRLMTDEEGEKLASLENGPIKTVDEERFGIDENKHLTLKNIPTSLVTGLDAILAGSPTSTNHQLVTETEKRKLEALNLGENNQLEISAKVNANNVLELEPWITARASTLKGLSENNFSDAHLEKLNNALTEHYISSVDEAAFTVESKKLSLNALPISKVTGLQDLLNSKVDTTTFTTLEAKVNANTSNIAIAMEAITWGTLAE